MKREEVVGDGGDVTETGVSGRMEETGELSEEIKVERGYIREYMKWVGKGLEGREVYPKRKRW